MAEKLTPAHPLSPACAKAKQIRQQHKNKNFTDLIVSDLYTTAHAIAQKSTTVPEKQLHCWQHRLDDIFTSRLLGYPVMLLLLCCVFWLTIEGANYPSMLLANLLFSFQTQLTLWFQAAGSPDWLHGILVLGMYRSLAWVVSVMLPPMAIFFPLFTILEDLGYLPRVAFNMDCAFKQCCASGKQALTMWVAVIWMKIITTSVCPLYISTWTHSLCREVFIPVRP